MPLVLGEHALGHRRPVGDVAELRSATSSCARIDVTRAAQLVRRVGHELALSCDDRSSRSSIAFIVCASLPTSSSVPGSGTRRWIVEPVIAAASARISSTGRSAWPAKYHASAADEQDEERHADAAARR